MPNTRPTDDDVVSIDKTDKGLDNHPMIRTRRARGAVLAVASLVVCAAFAAFATASFRSATGCDPSHKYCDPGMLPAGIYTTRYFLPGMRVPVPAAGWRSHQDSPDEFKLEPPRTPEDTVTIRFWIDPRASTPCSDKVLPVDLSTPARAVRWLRSDDDLVVSPPQRTTIAAGITAVRLDLNVSSTARRCDPSCPSPCITYFLFFGGAVPAPDLPSGHTAGVTDDFGTGRGEHVRLYFAQIGKSTHLLVVGIDTPNKQTFAALTSVAAKLLSRLRLPSNLPPKRQ